MIIIFQNLLKKIFSDLGSNLKKAGRREKSDAFIKKYSRYAFIFSVLLTLFGLFVILEGIANRGWKTISLVYIIFVFIVCFMFIATVFFSMPKLEIKKRKFALEADLLYSSRFLLLKLESGAPILNALIDVSKLHTKSSRVIGEIVSDVYLGTPIEKAINIAIENSPSESYTKILEEIKNSLKTGADLEKSLKSTLDTLTKEHMIEIKEYGKKLSPLSMMYMIIGTILPAMGSAILVVATGFIELPVRTGTTILVVMLVSLIITQMFFILFFKALKPQVMT
ncbi:MAG: type II secretion system F family protein [Nanoarchaeota archaeon]|nr:type II secretion system F family protein [Nanoarchaeota archaeon]